MEKGYSSATNMLNHYLPHQEIETFLEETKKRPIQKADFEEDIQIFQSRRSMEDYMTLRSYTGYNFRHINAVLRDNWNYEANGVLTPEKKEYFQRIAFDINHLIESFPPPRVDFQTYRGTTIREFQKYGIQSVAELPLLKGKFLYEEGFTSTSLEPESSYFKKTIDGHEINIEVVYQIPNGSQDGIPLITDDLSYSKEQKEYLLTYRTLSYVSSVQVENNTAHIEVIMIPKKVWNHQKEKETTESKQL